MQSKKSPEARAVVAVSTYVDAAWLYQNAGNTLANPRRISEEALAARMVQARAVLLAALAALPDDRAQAVLRHTRLDETEAPPVTILHVRQHRQPVSL